MATLYVFASEAAREAAIQSDSTKYSDVNTFNSINDALAVIKNATDDAGVSYTIELDGSFDEEVVLDWAENNDITFAKADGAEVAEITNKVVVGKNVGRYAKDALWAADLKFEGITFDYSDTRDALGEDPDWAAVNGERFNIIQIDPENTLTLSGCVFKGPGVIDSAYNGGQPHNNNGTADGDNGGNLFGTPWEAAAYQGKIIIENTSFQDGNVNFWRNSEGVIFSNCDFNNAPVTFLGDIDNALYEFVDCLFSMELDKIGGKFATYLVGATENAYGVQLLKSEDGNGCVMKITGTNAEGREVSYILSQAPNGDSNTTTVSIDLVGAAVAGDIPADVDFYIAKSPAETTGGSFTCDTIGSTLTATNIAGVTVEDLAGAANVTITNTLEDGTVQEITTDSEGVANESFTNADKVLYLNGETFTADLDFKSVKAASGSSKISDADVNVETLQVGSYSADEAIAASAKLELDGVSVDIAGDAATTFGLFLSAFFAKSV